MIVLFYKPYGVLSQFTPEPGTTHRTLSEFIPIPGVYAAGRLDHDSEGLLVLTDDGALQHRLTRHKRTYWAQVERVPSEEALECLRRGVLIPGGLTKPAQARFIAEPDLPPRDPPIRFRKSVPTAWIELKLIEGRNRQVRKMTAAVGHPTLRLVRFQVGEWTLSGLQPGQWRAMP